MAEGTEFPFILPLKAPRKRSSNSEILFWIEEKAPFSHLLGSRDKATFEKVCQRELTVFPFPTPLVPPPSPCHQTLLDSWIDIRKKWIGYFEDWDYATYQATRNRANAKRKYDRSFEKGPDHPETLAARLHYQEQSRVRKMEFIYSILIQF